MFYEQWLFLPTISTYADELEQFIDKVFNQPGHSLTRWVLNNRVNYNAGNSVKYSQMLLQNHKF